MNRRRQNRSAQSGAAGEPMKIACDTHGKVEWSGETICNCGRLHKLVLLPDGGFEWNGCECGATDPSKTLNPVCAPCWARVSTQRGVA